MKTVDSRFVDLVSGGFYLGRPMSQRDFFDLLNPKQVSFRIGGMPCEDCLVAKVEHPTSFLSWRIVLRPSTGQFVSVYWSRRKWNVSRISFDLLDVLEAMVI